MSTFGRPLTDDGLIRVLDHWLDDGPVVAPDLMVESALRTAARTPQRRWRGRVLRFTGGSPLVPVGLTLAAVAAVVALGAGLGQVLPLPGTEATPTPGVTDLPTPDASGLPSGLVVFTNPRDGYELTLPASWTPAEYLSNPSGTMRFGAAHSDNGPSSFGALTVSIGSADGIVRDCAPGPCRMVDATTIDELDAAIANGSTESTIPITATDIDVTLDGEPALLEYVTFGNGLLEAGPQFHHLFAIHRGRPVVLSFDMYAYGIGRQANDIGWVETLIQGFRFLDVAADAPTTGTFSFPELGYELSLPDRWTRAGTLDPSTFIAQSGNGTATVIVGDEASRIWTCAEPAGPWEVCQRATAPGLDALTAAVAPRPADEHGVSVPGRITRDTILLDGEDANLVGVQAYEYPAHGYEHVTYILAFHNGRPFILRFHTMLNEPPDGWIADFLAGFRFLDSAPSTEASPTPSGSGWRVVTDVLHGYALEVPAGWEDRECCSPGGRTLYAGEATPVMIMAGDSDGRITICQRGDCAEITATQLSDLRHAVRAVAPIDAASWRHTLRHDALTLGGEPAEREWPDSIFGAGPEPIYDWVYAIHDGRPIVLRFNHFRGKLNPSEQQRIIESFDFLD